MRKIYSTLSLIVGLLLATFVSHAQLVNGYQVQSQPGTYVPLGAGATRVAQLEADEAVVGGVPLGFTFVAAGRFHTEVAASSNGWIGMVYSSPLFPEPSSHSLSFSPPALVTIAPLWANLSGNGGTVAYQTTGTAPARVFTMEWRNFRWDQLAAQAVVSFQVKLYEGSNRVEFSYQPEAGSVTSTSLASQARAGITVYDNPSSRFLPVVLNDLSATPQINGSSNTGTLMKPASGQQFSFAPVPNTIPPCVAPTAYLGRLGRTSAQVYWARSQQGTTHRVHYGPRGFVLGTAADQVALGVAGDSAQLNNLLPETDYEFLLELDCGTSTALSRTSRTAFQTYMPASNDEGSRAIWVGVLNAARPNRFTAGFCTDASASLPANPTCAAPAGGTVYDVWYAFRATETRHQLELTSGGSAGTFVVELRDGYAPGSRSLACSVSPAPLAVSGLTVGQAYFIRIYPLTAFTYFSFGVLRGIATPPDNDQCATARPLAVAAAPGGLAATGGTLHNATASGIGLSGLGACALGGGGPSKDVFYQFVAPGAAAEVQLLPAFRAGIEVLSGCGNPGPNNYQDCAVAPPRKLSRLPLAGLVAGATYYLRVYNRDETVLPDDPAFAISVSAATLPPANDECAGALPLPVSAPLAAGLRGSWHGATSSGVPPPASPCYSLPLGTVYTPPAAARDVWYQFTATAPTHALRLQATADALLEVFAGTSPCAGGAGSTRLACAVATVAYAVQGGTVAALPARTLLTNLTVGARYWVRVFPLTEPTALVPTDDASFELSLNAWPAPANDEPATAVPLAIASVLEPCASRVEFTLDGATPTFPGPAGSAQARDIWFSFVAPAALAGNAYAVVLLRLGDGSSAQLSGGDIQVRDGAGSTASVLSPRLTSNNSYLFTQLLPGGTYYVRVLSTLGSPEPDLRFSLCLSVATNDEPCEALPLPLTAGLCSQPVRGTTYGATVSNTNPGLRLPVTNCGGQYARDVWYRVVPTTTAFTLRSDDVTINLARLYQPLGAGGSCSGTLRLVSCQTSSTANFGYYPLGTVLFDNLTVGQSYYLAVSSHGLVGGRDGSFTLCGQAATALPVRLAAGQPEVGLWPNPVAVGEAFSVQLPAGQLAAAQVRVEWLSSVGQVLPPLGPAAAPATNGVLRIETMGRAAGLYLLRLWLPNGQPLPVRRVVLQ